MKKKAIKTKEAVALIDQAPIDSDIAIQENKDPVDKNLLIESIMYYMAEIKRHRENLINEGIL